MAAIVRATPSRMLRAFKSASEFGIDCDAEREGTYRVAPGPRRARRGGGCYGSGMSALLLLTVLGCRERELEARLTAQEARISELASRIDQLAPTAMRTDGSGRVTTVLTGDGALKCAKESLEGIASAQRAYDAAFDRWGTSFQEIGWSPVHAGDCSTNVAFTMEAKAAEILGVPVELKDDVLASALITSGVGVGRSLVVLSDTRVFELARVEPAQIQEVLGALEWVGGR